MGVEATPETASEITEKLGHYRILGEAGRGGMSVVYEAVDDRFGRRVALKALSLPLSLAPDQRLATVARLKREARAIATLSHPNVVTIFDIGEERGQHFLVMEFLEGETLRERLNDGPLPPAEAAHILDQVASALDAVHEAGILHRDVKPSNVMLLPGGRVKLMDFGVARGSEDTLVTQAGMMVGSPAYMAPEQIAGETLGPACDVWALGVLLYEMLAGHAPFDGKNVPKVVYQVTHDDPPKIPGVSPAVQAVLKRALAKKPGARYPSARALADAYQMALTGRVAPPVPVPAAPRLPRPPVVLAAPPRRRQDVPRPILWASGLLGLVLLAALPQALHPRVLPAPRVVVLQRPLARTVDEWHPARVIPETPPVVRVASDRQELDAPAHPARPAVLRPHHQAPQDLLLGVREQAARQAAQQEAQERRTRRREAQHQAQARQALSEQQAKARQAEDQQAQARLLRERNAGQGVAHARAIPQRLARRTENRRAAPTWLAQAALPDQPPPSRHPRQTEPPHTLTKAPDAPPATKSPAVVETTPAPAASQPAHEARAGPNLLGAWHGRHSRNPAELEITRQNGDTFQGTMRVRTREASVLLAVEGRVSQDGGVSMHERRILSSTAPHAWDLGSESGRVAGEGKITGVGTDVKGRVGAWSFSR